MPLGWKKSRQGRGMTWYVLKSCLAVPSLRKAELFSLIFHLADGLCIIGMPVMPVLLNLTTGQATPELRKRGNFHTEKKYGITAEIKIQNHQKNENQKTKLPYASSFYWLHCF